MFNFFFFFINQQSPLNIIIKKQKINLYNLFTKEEFNFKKNKTIKKKIKNNPKIGLFFYNNYKIKYIRIRSNCLISKSYKLFSNLHVSSIELNFEGKILEPSLTFDEMNIKENSRIQFFEFRRKIRL